MNERGEVAEGIIWALSTTIALALVVRFAFDVNLFTYLADATDAIYAWAGRNLR
jgi:hypothetical protein